MRILLGFVLFAVFLASATSAYALALSPAPPTSTVNKTDGLPDSECRPSLPFDQQRREVMKKVLRGCPSITVSDTEFPPSLQS
jgi:hypothetical protein